MKNKTKILQELSLTLSLAPFYSTIHVASPHTKTSIIVTPHQNQDTWGSHTKTKTLGGQTKQQ